MYNQNCLLAAIDVVLTWDLPDEAFTDAVNDQVRLMAAIDHEDTWEFHTDFS
ncbi:hypothetical protein [Sulfurirhabdus autotrophica]|uniref:Uncharacterized protein n=1 Tax=Sulfurirhabdus autotrophica TaxID=1706046 RepID=A0A4R3Y5D8_9PROT|nr:hypothetical protein [Sulfurirhabdus autotrophica]TCV86651.1 hypothetical protein EDC63_10612 [Sulfurirhabdus autotrophica]